MQNRIEENTRNDSLKQCLSERHPFTARTWQFTALRNSTYPIGDRTVLCTLYRIDSTHSGTDTVRPTPRPHAMARYAVGMDSGSEQALCLLNNVGESVDEVFDMLVRHAVTPCTLTDVLADLSALKVTAVS